MIAAAGGTVAAPASRRSCGWRVSFFRNCGIVLGRAARRWYGDDAPQLGAALAYYSLFSVTPLLVIAAAIAGIAFGDETVRRQLEVELANQLGAEAGKALVGMMETAAKPRHGFWAAAIGTVLLAFGAVSLVVQFRSVLTRIWKDQLKPAPSGIWRTIGAYLVAILMVVGAGVVLMAALAVSAALAGLQGLGRDLPGTALLWRGVEFAASLAITTLVFALVFRLTSHFRWQHIWLGALVTALLYALGKALFGLYVELSGVQSGYGAAGALVVFLIWVYYTAQIVLFGAEVVAADAAVAAKRASSPDASAAYSGRS